MRQNKKINIWLIKDNKRGHDKQSEALANAIRAISNVEIIQIKYQTVWGLLFDSFLVFMGKKIARKKPDLIIGAGHSTHARMVVSKLFFGGRTIVIMKPSLPIFCFDLCLIPSHDRPKVKSNVIKTNGAINNIDNESRHSSSVGLILIGGKSKYFVWNYADITDQVNKIIKLNHDLRITISTSRRTPEHFITYLKSNIIRDTKIILYEDVSTDWLEDHAKKSKFAWVTEDSISMIYELVASGSYVTPIKLTKKGNSKISDEVERLINLKIINKHSGQRLKTRKLVTMNEARRCALIITSNWRLN